MTRSLWGKPSRETPDTAVVDLIIQKGYLSSEQITAELAEEFDDGWEDLFNVFLCRCTCSNCGKTSAATASTADRLTALNWRS